MCANKPWWISSGLACSLVKKVHLGGSTFMPITFLVEQNSPNFFRPIGEGLQLIKCFSDFRYVDPFWRHLRSKWKVGKNRAEFWTFLPSKILLGAPLPKSMSTLAPRPQPRPSKVMWGYSHHPKVIVINMLNFKPNFKCLPLKFFGRPRPSLWCASASLGECLAHVKIWGASTLGAEIWSLKKSWFGWLQTHMSYFLDSGTKFTRLLSPNAGGIVLDHVFPILGILSHSGDIRDQSWKLRKIGPNFACFWPQIF